MKYSYKVIVIGGLLAFAGCDRFFNKTTYLDTQKMQEADKGVVDSTMGPALISAYFCHKNNTTADTVPWADLVHLRSSAQGECIS